MTSLSKGIEIHTFTGEENRNFPDFSFIHHHFGREKTEKVFLIFPNSLRLSDTVEKRDENHLHCSSNFWHNSLNAARESFLLHKVRWNWLERNSLWWLWNNFFFPSYEEQFRTFLPTCDMIASKRESDLRESDGEENYLQRIFTITFFLRKKKTKMFLERSGEIFSRERKTRAIGCDFVCRWKCFGGFVAALSGYWVICAHNHVSNCKVSFNLVC
jgi:hypothetical protein